VYLLSFSFILSHLLNGNDSSSVIEMASFEILIDLVCVIVQQISENQSYALNWDLIFGSGQKKFVVETFLVSIKAN
jgi:DNA-binding protein Fis